MIETIKGLIEYEENEDGVSVYFKFPLYIMKKIAEDGFYKGEYQGENIELYPAKKTFSEDTRKMLKVLVDKWEEKSKKK